MAYLEKLPQPLLEGIVTGQVIPFIGAGFSQNATPPLPDLATLGADLAGQIPGYTYQGNPLDALTTYEQTFSRVQLLQTLAARLNPVGLTPGKALTALARLPFETIATTNFDLLLERTYGSLDLPLITQVTESQLTLATPFEGVKLFKFHGDLNHPDQMVVTEADYDGFAARTPLFAIHLAYLLTAYTPLFIGYSLDDYDFRSVWRSVHLYLKGFQRLGYTIQVGATPEKILRFHRRNVYVVNFDGDPRSDYPEILQGIFNELLAYWQQWIWDRAIATNDETALPLTTKAAASNPLCLLALPPAAEAAYRKIVFPVIRANGYTPCTSRDIYAPGVKLGLIYAMANRAQRIICAATFPFGNFFKKIYSTEKVLALEDSPSPGKVKASRRQIVDDSIIQRIADWLATDPG